MPDLPTGTVTLLFTDVEGSTRLLTELGDGYADVLAEHRRALRAAFVRHGGVEVDTQGDAFFVAFAEAGGALTAAADAQAALAGGPVSVRAGVHTGEPTRTEEGYVGLDVHRAARICAIAHGGQIVLSDRTRRTLETTVELLDLGLHRLKDIPDAERLYQLGTTTFPPLRSLNATNLPRQAGPIVGREREIAELARLVLEHRVVTATGPGGSGKTRLALEVAADAVGDFADGVFWVPLAAISDPALVEPEIAAAIGARGTPGEHVDEKRMLLLLDNLEHLLDAAPGLSALASTCPNLHLLLTSRAPLRIGGEREFAVEPLLAPDAVALFRERAFQVEPPEAVAAICRRLDELPLAIELAAARTRVLSPALLLERLEERLPLLNSGRRDAPERQRTLAATIAWSHDLLSPAEQQLFARLAVFRGGFTVETAEEVCEAGLDALHSLVEQSLARRGPDGRLSMLETIREFAVQRLEESGEGERMRRRHADWCLALVRGSSLSSEAAEKLRPDRVRPEQDNVRAALAWARDAGETELGLEIVLGLELFWHVNSPLELTSWLATFAPDMDVLPLELRARVLRVRGAAAEMSGDWAAGEALYHESLLCFRTLDDERGMAELQTRSAESARRRGDLERARALAEEAVQTARRIGDRTREAPALGILGHVEYDEGHHERGIELVEESAKIAAGTGFVWWQGVMLGGLAEFLGERGRAEEARRKLRESLRLLHEVGDRQNTLWALAESAKRAADAGYVGDAGRLWGAVEAEEARGPLGWWREERVTFEQFFQAYQGDPDFVRGSSEGRGLTLDDAVAYALELD